MTAVDDVVMVIEDEPATRTFMAELLRLEGFKVIACENGAEALQYLVQSLHLPCLIIMDMRMPVMDGPTFRAAMLADARLAEVPVVVVTAYEPAAAARLAARRVFRKPVDVVALLATVKEFC
ncbi:MAG TPA: response regulator [Candidatus Binataceae bacterium]|jgi:CheY-like chemotaxis protein|nr:response regulator [Candidatus Binataceae bacterium]